MEDHFPLYFERKPIKFHRGLSVSEAKRSPKLKNHYFDPEKLPPRHERYKMTIVWDLDQTLVSADGIENEDENNDQTRLVIRPRAEEVLSLLRRNGDVEFIVWTAGTESHARRVVNSLNTLFFDYVISRDSSWYPIKNLNKFLKSGRDLDTMILVDDRMDIGLDHPENLLVVPPYYPKEKHGEDDASLLYLANILQRAINLYHDQKPNRRGTEGRLPFYSYIFSPLTEKCVLQGNFYYGVRCFSSKKEIEDASLNLWL